MMLRPLLVSVLLSVAVATAVAVECPALLQGQGELPALRAKTTIDLCERFSGKPLIASFCG